MSSKEDEQDVEKIRKRERTRMRMQALTKRREALGQRQCQLWLDEAETWFLAKQLQSMRNGER